MRYANARLIKQSRTREAISAVLETLEGRRMLSASPLVGSADLSSTGVLDITGTRRADQISVGLNAADSTKLDVTINGVTSTFDLAAVRSVHMSGGNGKDVLRVDEASGAISLSVRLDGGNGKDVLVGGSGHDELYGGKGKDDLDGGAGDDDLYGEAGKDSLDGEEGDDDLDGGKGKDACRGGAGSDSFDDDDGKREVADREADDDVLVALADVPEAVRGAFALAFAGATVDEIQMETEDDGTVEYEFEFTTAAGFRGEAEYDAAGTLLEAEMPVDMVPPTVRSAFDAAFSASTVHAVEMELEDGGISYEFEFTAADGSEGEAEFAADGLQLVA